MTVTANPFAAPQSALAIAAARLRTGGKSTYYDDPAGFAAHCIQWPKDQGLTGYQNEILTEFAAHHRAAVRGPHGLGKSTVDSLALLWFATTRDQAGVDWKIATTAGAWRQLEKYLWPEVHKWAKRLRPEMIGRPRFSTNELLTLNLKLTHGQAFAVASDDPQLIEGVHADEVLYIFDESKAIPAGVFDAAEGAFSGGGAEGSAQAAYALATSTPGSPAGRFYDIHRRKAGFEDWWTRHVTDAECIAAGRMSNEWREARKRQWGENSGIYANRVLGEFHSDDESGLIPLAWVEAANERHKAWLDAGKSQVDGPRTVGVDVARSGEDATVLAIRDGDCITRLDKHNKEDTMQTTGRVKGILEADPTRLAIVDVIGVGGGVVDRLREMKLKVSAFNASEKTDQTDKSGELGFLNCLTGDARVTPIGGLRRIYRSRYEGPLFKIETARGDTFTATSNHQVLTLRGWVAVESLDVGDQLCDAGRSDPALSPSTRPEVDNMPPMLSEVYRSACSRFGSERVESSTVNFHGDRPAGDVDVVTVNGNLQPIGPSLGQHGEDLAFVVPLLSKSALLSQRLVPQRSRQSDGHGREGSVFPSDGMTSAPLSTLSRSESVEDQVVRFRDRSELNPPLNQRSSNPPLMDAQFDRECSDRFAGDVSRHDIAHIRRSDASSKLSLNVSPWLESVLTKDAADYVSVHPEVLAQRMQTLTGQVPTDKIVRIEVIPGTVGHEAPFVYTLETETGSYHTTNVVHRNCRAAAWWSLRELLDPAYGSDLMLPDDDLLTGDLCTPTWKVQSGGKIQVESKDEIRKRLGRSTDCGDAVVQAYWEGDHTAQDWIDHMRAKAEAETSVTPAPVPTDDREAMRQSAFREMNRR